MADRTPRISNGTSDPGSSGPSDWSRRDVLTSAAAAAGVSLWGQGARADGAGADSSSRRRSSDRPSQSESAPNILFLFPDQHRYDWLPGGRDHVPVRMPNLRRLAARGVRFDRAYCGSPLCAPSRACLASGQEYDRCEVPYHGTPYPLDKTTFYELLRDAGYHTMGCGKFDLDKAHQRWGIDGTHWIQEWGFSAGINSPGKWDAVYDGEPKDPYNAYLQERSWREVHYADMERRRDDPRLDPESWGHYKATHATDLPERAYSDNFVAQNGLKLIDEAPEDRPWFLQINFPGPHEPMDVTHRMHTEASRYGARYPEPFRSAQLTPEHHQRIRRNYSAMCENIDRWLGIYEDALRRRGEWQNTIVVYSSDHGEMLGDRDRWAKKVPHEASVGVPLVMAGPGIRSADGVQDALVSLVDLAPTFLEAAGEPVPDFMDGRSLGPLLRGETDSHRERVYSGLFRWRMVREGRYKLVRGFDVENGPIGNQGEPALDATPPVLYDLADEPDETRNLADDMPGRVERMTEMIRG